MKKHKIALISKIGNLNQDTLNGYFKLPYDKIFLLYSWWKKLKEKLPAKISIVPYKNLVDFKNQINEIFRNNLEYKFIPYFSWDSNSKYAINIFNKSFLTDINPKIFKEKDYMISFLWDLAYRKHKKFTYKDLISQDYESLKEIVWEKFVLKPTNWSSSTSTFKISSEEELANAKTKISKVYNYLIDEYIDWKILSLDFFFDWERMFLLTYVHEVSMIELLDHNKFSPEFIAKYWDEVKTHFNFILALRYNVCFEKISKTEINYLSKLKEKLKEIWYRGIIHLEYKYDSLKDKLGFIEWGARYWWNRRLFIQELFNTDPLKLPYYLLVQKDFSKFTEIKSGIFRFKEKKDDLNIVWVKTNFIKTTNYIEILKKTWNITEISFWDFLLNYYKKTFSIKVKDISFYISSSKDFNFYPFYRNNNTKFDYILKLDDKNFSLFKKKKFKIIESVFFHNYK